MAEYVLNRWDDFRLEVCCEVCNEVWHTHFNCPACKDEDAGSDDFSDDFVTGQVDSIKCEECGAQFKAIERKGDTITIQEVTP
jgi:transcription elongation factor Elf1